MPALVNSALIVGGGFSGLCAGIQLLKAGVDVDIVEINPAWRADGAGLTVSGPSLRALDTVGVLDRFFEHGATTKELRLHTATGFNFQTIPFPPVPRTRIDGTGGIMRPVLCQILVDKFLELGGRGRLGTTFKEINDRGEEVNVTFDNGDSGSYDLLIGADGVFSRIRNRLFADAPQPSYSGQVVWRAVIPRFGVETAEQYIGRNSKVGFSPVSDEQSYMYFTEKRDDLSRLPEEQLLPTLKELMAEYTAPIVVKIREALNEDSQIIYRPLEGMMLPRPWYKGRIILIGDAVHATTPHLASGAGMGFEDGVVIAEELCKEGSVGEALERYQNRRWARCNLVVSHSKRLGDIEIVGFPIEEHAQIMAISTAALMAPI